MKIPNIVDNKGLRFTVYVIDFSPDRLFIVVSLVL